MTVSTAEFLSTLRERDIRLWVEDGRLRCEAPPNVLDEELRTELADRKDELMTLIAGAESLHAAPRSLVPLKPTGDELPVFARPGHNGDVFAYRALVEHLAPGRPLYGVEPRGLDGGELADTVEEMAAYEVQQIRAFQPDGPYIVAGFCAGGAVAFEAARQLHDDGAEVERVLLLGAPIPAAYRENALLTQLRSVRHRTQLHASRMRSRSFSEGLEYVGTRVSGRLARAGSRPDPSLANRRRIEEATIAAVKEYEPGFYPGRIDLFLPNEAWRHTADRPEDWRLVAERVVEHVGPDECDGDSMLHEPYVQDLAKLLDEALADEGGNDAASR